MTAENPRRHLFLLIALLFIFILSPFVLPFYYGPTIMNVVGAVVLLSATYAVSGRRLFLIIAAHTSAVLLIGFFAVAILVSVLGSGRVTADKIYGAICAYLLLGYAWAFAYSVIEEIQHGSFATLGPATNDIVSRVMQMRYFSFVTLATVGYGDVVPRMPLARTVALLEAMVGQFYLVALIGRLVGLHIVHGNPERSGQRSD
jgi:hypothetical protein